MSQTDGTGTSLAFRVDGSNQIGMGHVMRCIYLAGELKESHNIRPFFIMKPNEAAVNTVQRAGYPVLRIDQGVSWEEERESAMAVARESWARGIVIDLRPGPPIEYVTAFRDAGLLTVVLDDMGESRLAVDLVFYPIAPEAREAAWPSFSGKWYEGPEYAIIASSFREKSRKSVTAAVPRIVVSMGGSDPQLMTVKALEALELLDQEFETTVIIGPAFAGHSQLSEFLESARREYNILYSPQDMAAMITGADLALISFGITVYEVAALGVPALVLCPSLKHEQEASALASYGTFVTLGYHQTISSDTLARSVRRLLRNPGMREAMSQRGRALVDGRGAERVADVISGELKTRALAASRLSS